MLRVIPQAKNFLERHARLAYEPKGEARPPHELAARASHSHYSRGEVPQGALDPDARDRRVSLIAANGRSSAMASTIDKFVIDVGTIGKHISRT